jgi:aspartyl-tRNA synthetase
VDEPVVTATLPLPVGGAAPALDVDPDFSEFGWVHDVDRSSASFSLRNRFGTRVICCHESPTEVAAAFVTLQPEAVVQVEGAFEWSADTGMPAVQCTSLRVLNTPEDLPFTAGGRRGASPNVRARYRYLEFRDAEVLRLLVTRHRVVRAWSSYLHDRDFIAVETPILSCTSETGAREFEVRSARSSETRYCLPQSSQVYGQLLVSGGVERYFQFARCFRDEDLRADRQPEFTQLHIEMAFADDAALMDLIEDGLRWVFLDLGLPPPPPFPRISYAEAISVFGTDKPDLRFDSTLELLPFRLTEYRRRPASQLIISHTPAEMDLSGRQWGFAVRAARRAGFEHLGYLAPARLARQFLPRAVSVAELRAIGLTGAVQPGGMPVWVGSWSRVHRLRRILYRYASQGRPPPGHRFVWVTDFPLFEPAPDSPTGIASANNPFVAPHNPQVLFAALNKAQLLRLTGQAFDLVLDGDELGSGSVVIHRLDLQLRVLRLLGLNRKEVRKFGFLLESLKYGAPPTAGFGLGVDRLVAHLCGCTRIRDVIAFPKTKTGRCPVTSPI